MPNTSDPSLAWWPGLRHTMRRWRRSAKARLPYVRRREFAKVARQHDSLADAIGLGAPRADEACVEIRKPVVGPLHGEVCLFLSHHSGPALKPHVREHIEHLLVHGIQVVLVLNVDDLATKPVLDDALVRRLRGIFVRENIGFDFAGWAHVYSMIAPALCASRLFLVNDSIVGPLDRKRFSAMLSRIRSSRADMLGLTEALAPRPHLQSFFLAFNQRLLDRGELASFFKTVLCFADKSTVIEVYETRLTQRMRDAGYRCEALFPALSDDPHASNDTYFRWAELLDCGFPYVKTSVLREFGAHPQLRTANASTGANRDRFER